MIADDRGSQIADRRPSQRELFPYDRRRSQVIAEPTVADFGQRKCQNLIHARNHSKQNGGRRGRNFAASKLIIPLVNRF